MYSRAVNKTYLSNRIIDGKELQRCFEKDEIDSLSKVDDWVECVKCHNWRMFPPDHNINLANLPTYWHCGLMNKYDARIKWSCTIGERDSEWYHQHFKLPNQKISDATSRGMISINRVTNKLSTEEHKKLLERDHILKDILTVRSSLDSSTAIVGKYYFHDTLQTPSDHTNSKRKAKNNVYQDAEFFEKKQKNTF